MATGATGFHGHDQASVTIATTVMSTQHNRCVSEPSTARNRVGTAKSASTTTIPAAADTLRRVPALIDGYEAVVKAGRAPGSPARVDAALPAGRTAYDLATSAWLSGGDNLLAWHHLRLGASVQPPSAQYTLLRGALEGAVTCRWLVDPWATSKERRRRGAIAQLEDYVERGKFEASIDTRPFVAPAKSGADRAADLRQLLVSEGEMAADATADPRSLSMTDRFKLYAMTSGYDGSWLYRVLSAFAHGRQWPLAPFGEIVERVNDSSGDGVVIKLTAREGPVDGVTVVAFLALQRALAELTWYMGHGPRPPRVKFRPIRSR